ncbi:MAG: hypothetical protein MAG795_00987 [Candidatus Woesearchaeota archaeon]|nr:hypothetical protein [Candidatus Woesearchaeota archaeon]
MFEELKDKLAKGFEIFYVGRENHQLREELRKLGFTEEARKAKYYSLDLPGLQFEENVLLIDKKLYTFADRELEYTGIERTVNHSDFAGAITITYTKKGEVLHEDKRYTTGWYHSTW